ncbi:MAG: hypothetical protein ACOYXW_09215 [Actinomycetota bacterium]
MSDRAQELYSSVNLDGVWQEACRRAAGAPPGSAQAELWAAARARLCEALQQTEDVAARRCPPLGRRRWSERSAAAVRLPAQTAITRLVAAKAHE